MQPLRVHRGLVAPLLRRDIDTDQIIPKQFLKSTSRSGFGKHLFHDWRCLPDGAPNPNFVLNQTRYAQASILVSGPNFGCGSSREHAAWALREHGFRAVIAPSFADIFCHNAVSNGVGPLVVSEAVATELAEHATTIDGYMIEIDLEQRRLRDQIGLNVGFELDDSARYRLLHGLDAIALILQHENAISSYERRLRMPTPRHS
jgi:3-isopropylmalate/(R)-2-methylmalate dehydratase small subunit